MISGTSFAAPHVAGGAGLMLEWDTRKIKALMLNTAEKRGSPDFNGWDKGYGYGYLDLHKAFNQRTGTTLITLNSSQSRTFRGWINNTEQVTITWHKRPTYTLSDIDLYLLRAIDRAIVDWSNTVIQNVEQVRYNGQYGTQLEVLVEVRPFSFPTGVTSEDVALALPNTTFTEVLAPPRQAVTSGSEENKIVNDLGQNFPNAFNPETWIPYSISQDREVIIRIYNTQGQLVRSLNLGKKVASRYFTKDKAAYWDGHNENGEKVASGVYFYHIEAGGFSATIKMVMKK